MRSTSNQENAQSLLKAIARGARRPQLRITILAALNLLCGAPHNKFHDINDQRHDQH